MPQAISEYLVQAFVKDVIETQRCMGFAWGHTVNARLGLDLEQLFMSVVGGGGGSEMIHQSEWNGTG